MRGSITHIVDLGRHAYHDLQPLPPLALLRWQSEQASQPTRVVVLPDDRSLDIRAALEALGGENTLGPELAFDVILPQHGRWDLHKLHPGRQALMDELRQRGRTVRLADIADVRRGERTVTDPSLVTDSLQEALPTIRGRDIKADGIVPVGELELLVPATLRNRRPFTMASGDLIGQEIGERNRWAVIGVEHAGALPGQTTVVVRPHPDCPVPPQYLAAYLNSRLAQRLLAPSALGIIPRVRPRDLVELPVPVPPLAAHSITQALVDIDETLLAANSIVTELAAARDALFDATSSRDMATGLEDAANSARALRPVLVRQEDPAGRLRAVLPYPIARTLRTWAISEGPRERYEAMLEITEAVAVTLGVIGLAWSRETENINDGRQNWQRGLYGAGTSLGHWADVADQAAAAARQSDDPLGGFADALRTRRGNRGLLADLRVLINERNDARHGGAGPRSRAEAQDRLRQRELTLDGLFKQLPFLAGMPFRLVERIARDPTTGDYTARTLRVVGDHPDFEPETIRTPDGLFDGVMYVQLSPSRMLSLAPFCSWLDCSQCLRPEVYFIDRIRDGRTARLKSFDRGHKYESDQIVEELRKAGFEADYARK